MAGDTRIMKTEIPRNVFVLSFEAMSSGRLMVTLLTNTSKSQQPSRSLLLEHYGKLIILNYVI